MALTGFSLEFHLETLELRLTTVIAYGIRMESRGSERAAPRRAIVANQSSNQRSGHVEEPDAVGR